MTITYDAAEHARHAECRDRVCPCGTIVVCRLMAANEYRHERQLWSRADPQPGHCWCQGQGAAAAAYGELLDARLAGREMASDEGSTP